MAARSARASARSAGDLQGLGPRDADRGESCGYGGSVVDRLIGNDIGNDARLTVVNRAVELLIAGGLAGARVGFGGIVIGCQQPCHGFVARTELNHVRLEIVEAAINRTEPEGQQRA